jgi:hypothetical protein
MRKYGIILSSFVYIVFIFSSVWAVPYGIVSGVVRCDSDLRNIPAATISAYDTDGNFIKSSSSDSNGHFSFEMPAGEYYLSAEKDNIVKEFFPGVYLLKNAEILTVFVGQQVSVNFDLDFGGWISGIVNFNGETINSSLITAIKIDQPDEGWDKSVSLEGPFPSAYAISGLYPGVYKIVARGTGKGTEYYPGVDNFSEAQAVTVTKNEGVSEISFNLEQVGRGIIRGRVTDYSNGSGISDVQVYAYQWKDYWDDPNLVVVRTICDGSFNMRLPAGEYYLFALALNPVIGSSAIPIYYNNCYNSTGAETVEIQSNADISGVDFNVDFSIRHDLTISGVVSSGLSGRGLGDVTVSAINYESGKVDGVVQSSTDGSYSINHLSAGNYLLMYSGGSIIPYFYPQSIRWQDGEVIRLMGHFGNVRVEAITQDYGNNGLYMAGGVVSDSGPLAGARVYAFREGQSNPVAFSTTDDAGQYTINRGLTPGIYTVMCDFLGYNYEIYPSEIHLDLVIAPQIDGIDFHLLNTSNPVISSITPPAQVSLDGNYPNPFNSSTTLVLYSSDNHSKTGSLRVYNILGQSVGQKMVVINPGVNYISWNSGDFNSDVSSGTYFYKVDGISASRRMLYLK